MIASNVKRKPEVEAFEKIGAELIFSGDLFKKEGKNFIAKLDIAINGIPKEKREDLVVAIHCEFLVYYEITDELDISDEELKIFCESNALYNVWPYFREHVSSMCHKMNIPQLFVPLLRFVQEKPKQKASNGNMKEEKKEDVEQKTG